MRNEEQEIFDAGQKYQTILDKMKLQRTEYARFVSHVGSLESRVLNGDMESAINLPVMPQLKEFTLPSDPVWDVSVSVPSSCTGTWTRGGRTLGPRSGRRFAEGISRRILPS
jgi:hypothetical protein